MSLSLRTHALVITLLLVTLTVGMVVVLVLTTTRMEHNSARMLRVLESIQTTEALEKRLLFHERELRLYEATGKPEHAREVEAAVTDLRLALEHSRPLVETQEERMLLDELSAGIEDYLANPSPSPGTPEEASGRMLDRQIQLSQRLVELNFADARATLAANQRWDGLANVVGLGVALALVVGVALVLWSVRRWVYWPLQRVRQVLLSFRPGASPRAVPSTGLREIQDIAHAFNETASRLERQREVQLSFLAGVAHDLRNPLQALRMAAASVRPGHPLPPEDTLRQRFALVARQVDRLNRMVEDLLDTTQMEAGKLSLDLDEHDLIGLVREAVELHRPLTQSHELVTSWPEGTLWMRCDSTRISQVLDNLLSNAIKYSPGGGRVPGGGGGLGGRGLGGGERSGSRHPRRGA